ncbi:MAG: NIF family HAD-type phosphatase [Deltaproteobacteria bacterium]
MAIPLSRPHASKHLDRNLLVLDIDETLVYAAETPLEREPDFRIAHYAVYVRPHAREFIDSVLQWFDVAVWTSAGEEYAALMVARLFPDPSAVRFVWGSNRCTRRFNPETYEQYWIKDFKKLKRIGYDLCRVLVIDDSTEKHTRNYGNLIRVFPFTGDQGDRELANLLPYLASIRDEENYRTIEKRNWRHIVSQLRK